MWFIKLIFKLLYRIIKYFKWPGVCFILLCIELMIVPELAVYFMYQTASDKIPETMMMDARVTEAGVNDEGIEGHWIQVTITNSGHEEQIVRIGCKGESANYLTYDHDSVYTDIDKEDVWYNQVLGNTYVPAGTEVSLRFFITKDMLSEVEGEQLIFRDAISGKYAAIPILELRK